MSRLHVHLYRDSFKTPWGFRLQGGKDLKQPLTVQRVFSNSPAEGELQRGDEIQFINNLDTTNLTHKDAQDKIRHGGGQIDLVIRRPPPGTIVSPLSPPIITPRPRAPSLQDAYYPNNPSSVYYNQSPGYSTMNGDPYYGYRPDNRSHHKSKPTYLQIQVSPPSHQTQPQYQHTPSTKYKNQHQQYYLEQLEIKHQRQPSRHRSSWSQPPVTPTTPTPPWASQQATPKRVSKLSQLGGGGQNYGTTYNTLPRGSTAQYGAYTMHRPRPDFDPDEEREPDLPLATGPVPKVCSRRNLGGGATLFGTTYGDQGRSATLPRRRLSQPPSLPSAGGPGIVYSPSKVSYGGPQADYGYKGYGQTPAQRVQTTLDNITLSPRTPEAQTSYKPFSPAQQAKPSPPQPAQSQLSPQYQPHRVYSPRSFLLENQHQLPQQPKQYQPPQPKQYQPQPQQYQPQPQQYQPQQYQPQPQQYQPQPQQYQPQPQQYQLQPQQYQPQPQQYQPQPQQYQPQPVEDGEDEEIPPVWERRRMFQQIDNANRSPARAPMNYSKPKAPKTFSPGSANNMYGSNLAPAQSNAVWRPSHQQPPLSPGQQGPSMVHSTPPPWKRPEDDVDDSTPAWRSTLKSASGVKPWERDVDYQQQPSLEQPARSVPHTPAPPQSSAPAKPGDNPKLVHLQYNSPMGLYSNQNVAETYESHAKVLSPSADDALKPSPSFNDAGDRDWSQSAVLQFLNQEKKTKRSAPKPAAKPHQQSVIVIQQSPPSQQQHHMQQPYYSYNDAAGTSDF